MTGNSETTKGELGRVDTRPAQEPVVITAARVLANRVLEYCDPEEPTEDELIEQARYVHQLLREAGYVH